LKGIRVVVLDDTEDGQELLAAILRSAGGTVKTCASAAEGIAAVSAFRPHVIVADIGMPDDDGYAFLRTLRSLPAKEGGLIPAVALTPTGHADEAHRGLRSGFQTYVPKPVEPGRLVAAVTTLTSDGHARRAEA
jgi:CheY-like chemotaxis protein